MSELKTHAIIVAAGKGVRFGKNENKIWHEVENKPLLYYAVQTFEECHDISNIYIVCHKEEVDMVENFINKFTFSKIRSIIIGGFSRQQSVNNALRELQENINNDFINENDNILVHNAANPLLRVEDLQNLIEKQKIFKNVALGRPVSKSIKKVDTDGTIIEHIDRNDVWEMETPQGAELKNLINVHTRAAKDGYEATDETELLTRYGYKVKVIETCPTNIKITHKIDQHLLNPSLFRT